MGILLFNWFGYQVFCRYLQHHADRELEARLDKNEYDLKDLIEIKIPLHLPYLSNESDFTRYNGEMDLNGKHYTYVKRRIYNDSLVLLCVVNRSRQTLSEARSNYFTLVNGLQSSSRHQWKDHGYFKSLLAEYQPEQNDWTIHPFLSEKQPLFTRKPSYIYSCYAMRPEQPPEKWL